MAQTIIADWSLIKIQFRYRFNPSKLMHICEWVLMDLSPETLISDRYSQFGSTSRCDATLPVCNRVTAIDVIRGIALFGVLMVNLTTEFRVSIFQQFLGMEPTANRIDLLVTHIVAAALETKAFALFSLLFGVGLAIQFERLTSQRNPFYWLVRRLLILLGFGLLHLLLIWNGDILTEYALVGLFALPFLLLRVRYLAIAAFAFLLAFAMQSSMWSIQWPAADLLKQHVTASNEIFSTGSYADVVQFSYRELPMLLPLHLYVLPRTIALFLFGMLFWRVGVFTNPARYRNQIRFAAAAGVLGGAAIFMISGGGWFASSALFMEGALNLAPAILAVGYGAGILTLMGSPRVATFLGAFAPLGKMAFTNYLLQSVICGFVFFGYGLGQFSHMAVAPAFGFGLVIYAGQMVLSSVWLRYYKFGPVEWAWRSLMYGKIQPMSIK